MFLGLLGILAQIIAFALAISVHEAAHALMSDRLGDPTARLQGRLSLNPLQHIDLFGTVLLPLFLILSGAGFVIGWAKPVMFDPFNLRNPQRDSMLIGLAGPVSNLLAAALASIVLRILTPYSLLLTPLITPFIFISIILAIFNLIPIHPLDGGKIVTGLLPRELAIEWEQIQRQWGMIILIFLILPWGGVPPVFYLIGPVINLLVRLLLPSGGMLI